VQPESEALAEQGFTDEALQQTAEQAIGAGADANLPATVRFRRSAVWLIRERLKQLAGDVEADPAVFLLSPAPQRPDGQQAELVPMLSNGLTELGRRVWFVGPMCNSGHCHDLEVWDDREAFRLVVDELRLGDAVAVVFDPRSDPFQVRYYPNGLGEHDTCQLIQTSVGYLSIDDVLAKITEIHQDSLVTPTALGSGRRIWARSRTHYVTDNAEAVIQGCLQSSLQRAYPSCTVRPEQPQVSGRVDLEIEEPEPDDRSRVTRHALLELKVLRSFSSGGTPKAKARTKTEISDGLTQARVYRDEKGTRAAALCCFDMRAPPDTDACFEGLRTKAREWKVTLAAWPLYASSSDYRASA
jgi:hypothetical protein